MANTNDNLNANEQNERAWQESYNTQEETPSYNYSSNQENQGINLDNQSKASTKINVGKNERVASGVGGGLAATYGLKRGDLLGYGVAALGASLMYRSATGHCSMYQALGVNTAKQKTSNRNHQNMTNREYPEGHTFQVQKRRSVGSRLPNFLGLALIGTGAALLYRELSGNKTTNTRRSMENVSVQGDTGVKVEKSITINASPEKLYNFWRNFENLPQIMNHLESVTELDNHMSHWIAKAPLGTSVKWDAEIITDTPNQMISWRSLEGADVDNAGSVHFEDAADGNGTLVRVSLKYNPPAGKLGSAIAWLTGEEPSVQVEEDLQRFKNLMEATEVPATGSQTSGRTKKSKSKSA